MRLTSTRSSLELTILDYDVPHGQADPTERNVLLISLLVTWHQNQSIRIAPILLTWEVVELRHWLQHLITHPQPLSRLHFSEPCFGIECLSAVKGEYLLQVFMKHEVAPDWHYDVELPFWLPIIVDESQVRQAIAYLAAQSRVFPVR